MSGIDHANGHRPDGLLDMIHPLLQAAPRPELDKFSYDLDKALKAVVKLYADVPPDAYTAASLGTEREGSGIVLDSNGLVLTIGYLMSEASHVTLTMTGGETVDAEPIAYDHETGFGMVQAIEPMDVEPLEIGDSSLVAMGDSVVVASFGGLSHSIDGRVMSVREFAGSWEYLLDEAIYTMPVHPYWGGGALIDQNGKLVGVGSLYVEQAIGETERLPGNMFVPINLLKPIRAAMLSTGRADRPKRPWLAMHTADTTERLFVTRVGDDGPADLAGIEAGDIVLSVEGVAVTDLAHMYRTIWAAGPPGTDIRFTVLRDDDVLSIRVRSADRYNRMNLPRRH
jgi:S1-C subfamily serine protease